MEKPSEDRGAGRQAACDDRTIPEAEWLARKKRVEGLRRLSGWIYVVVAFGILSGLLCLATFNIWYVIVCPVPIAMLYIGLWFTDKTILLRHDLKCPWCGIPIRPDGRALREFDNRLSSEDVNCPHCRQPVIEVDYKPMNVVTHTITREDMINLYEWSAKCRQASWAIGTFLVLWIVLSAGIVIVLSWVAERSLLYGLLLVTALLGLTLLALFWPRWVSEANSVVCPACGIKIGPNGYGLGQKEKGYVRLNRSSRRCPRCRTVILSTEEEGNQ
jgi:hypothetical protein